MGPAGGKSGAELVIAADGLHSVARMRLVADQPVNSSHVAHLGVRPGRAARRCRAPASAVHGAERDHGHRGRLGARPARGCPAGRPHAGLVRGRLGGRVVGVQRGATRALRTRSDDRAPGASCGTWKVWNACSATSCCGHETRTATRSRSGSTATGLNPRPGAIVVREDPARLGDRPVLHGRGLPVRDEPATRSTGTNGGAQTPRRWPDVPAS